MKKIKLLFSIALALISTALFSQSSGILDNTFGSTGKVTTSMGIQGEVWGMAMQDDWSIVVGGYSFNGVDSDFALIRYLQNGGLDSSFGLNGKVITAMGSGSGIIKSIVIQPDGKILAAGWAWNGTDYDFAVARYKTNGSLDSTFGTNGKVTTAIGPGDDIGNTMLLEDDWSIVVGGSSFNGTDNDFVLVRYLTNGTVDAGFGANGKVVTAIGTGDDEISAMAMQPDSSIIVAGTVSDLTSSHFALARYHANGTLDNSFGTNGKVITMGGMNDDEAYSMSLQHDGKIVVGGYAGNGVNDDFGLMRYMANGSLDSSYGINGRVITAVSDSDEAIYGMMAQPDGKIVAAGSSMISGIRHYAMARYKTDGTLDSDFGSSGLVTTTISPSNNEAYVVAMQDGKIVSAGYADNGSGEEFSVARYISGLNLGVVDFTTSGNSILIYPNPVEQNATLQYTLTKEQTVAIRLVDMQGRTVKTLLTEQRQEIGDHKQALVFPDGLASGSYLLVLSSPDGQMSIKIVK